MKLEEIKALSDRELDALLAEKVLGWHRWDGMGDWDGPEGETIFYPSGNGQLWVYDDGAEDITRAVSFVQSLDAISPLEAKCVEKFDYLCALWETTGGLEGVDCVTASARHRAEAVLYCWEGE